MSLLVPRLTKFSRRRLEWMIAFYTIIFGWWLLMPWKSMNTFTFYYTLHIANEVVWGAAYMMIGLCHVHALHINGSSRWSPVVRATALLINANVFLAMAMGIITANPGGTGTVTYLFMVFGFCGAAMCSAASDVGKELKIWRKNRKPKGDGQAI